jgi:hypothetical protein
MLLLQLGQNSIFETVKWQILVALVVLTEDLNKCDLLELFLTNLPLFLYELEVQELFC